jgi:hypothetical protein
VFGIVSPTFRTLVIFMTVRSSTVVENGGAGAFSRRSKIAADNPAVLRAGMIGAETVYQPRPHFKASTATR